MIWPDWSGETVAVIGSGPSRTQDQVDYCRGRCRVIVLCHEFRAALWADWLHAGDASWWQRHSHGVGRFPGQLSSYGPVPWLFHVIQLEGLIERGRDSAFQAAQIAAKSDARRVALIGIDMQPGPVAEHAHDHYRDDPIRAPADYPAMIECWRTMRWPIEIVNCSPDSALDWFPKADIRELLCRSPI